MNAQTKHTPGQIYVARYWIGAAREANRHALQARADYRKAKGRIRSAHFESMERAKSRRDIFIATARAAIAKAVTP